MGDIHHIPARTDKAQSEPETVSISMAKPDESEQNQHDSMPVLVIVRPQRDASWLIFVALIAIAGLLGLPLGGKGEAKAYLQHRILSTHFLECCRHMLQLNSNNAADVMGTPDDIKLRSWTTLFAQVSVDDMFNEVLMQYFQGKPDQATIDIL